METKELRTATKNDFKRGAVLVNKQGNVFRIVDEQVEGVWGTGRGGCLFEDEAHLYKVVSEGS